jgi:hypothetical protein
MDWGCCVLRVAGEEFDPDAHLRGSSLKPYEVYHRGEQLAPVGKRAQLRHEEGGFKYDVSDAVSLADQVRDATEFLKLHGDALAQLACDPTVRARQLDFGYECRLSERVVVQGEYLPPEFLRLAGSLEISIALSLYPSGRDEARAPGPKQVTNE